LHHGKKYFSPYILSFDEPLSPSLTISSGSVQMNKLVDIRRQGVGGKLRTYFIACLLSDSQIYAFLQLQVYVAEKQFSAEQFHVGL
jgi:hypothetical protein